jgi:carbon-monoxide dehydrogenase small subunit
MSLVQLTVNDQPISIEIAPRTNLADVLREQLGLTGTHLGCEHGVCGACTVLLDGKPVRSCIVLGVACESREVRTIEGFDDDAVMAELRTAFKREHGLQCGFCTPGMLIAAHDIVVRLDSPDEARIRRELSGNLCRCTGYVGIVRAVCHVGSMQIAKAYATPSPKLVADFERASTAAHHDFTPSRSSDQVEILLSEPDKVPAGWSEFSESFVVDGDVDAVWSFLVDVPRVARCLPGAEVTDFDESGRIKGRLNLKLGPIRAALTGSAALTRNDVEHTAILRGAGSDAGSQSRTQGRMIFGVEPDTGGARSRVTVAVAYNVQGPLAQFSRSGVAREVGRLLIEQFARNLNNRLSGERDTGDPAEVSLKLSDLFRSLTTRLFRRKAKDQV